ncbi:MAG: type II secretion system F family protein [Candidatus Micrarchaeia archaeon]
MRVPLFLVPSAISDKIAHKLKGIGVPIASLFPSLKYELKMLKSKYDSSEYAVVSIFNALAWAFLVLILMLALLYAKPAKTKTTDYNSIILAFIGSLLLFFFVFIFYPRILVGKAVEAIDKDLVYAVRDMMVQITSGVSLYDSMVNISESSYGDVSKEFKIAVQEISAGKSQEEALERMALRTESRHLKKMLWQIINTLKAGASLQGALQSIVHNMEQYQSSEIKTYIQEMNLWILIYVVVAVVIPTLGTTLLIILSSFAGIRISEMHYVELLILCFVLQFVLIEFVRIKRPVIHA